MERGGERVSVRGEQGSWRVKRSERSETKRGCVLDGLHRAQAQARTTWLAGLYSEVTCFPGAVLVLRMWHHIKTTLGTPLRTCQQ